MKPCTKPEFSYVFDYHFIVIIIRTQMQFATKVKEGASCNNIIIRIRSFSVLSVNEYWLNCTALWNKSPNRNWFPLANCVHTFCCLFICAYELTQLDAQLDNMAISHSHITTILQRLNAKQFQPTRWPSLFVFFVVVLLSFHTALMPLSSKAKGETQRKWNEKKTRQIGPAINLLFPTRKVRR